MLSQSRQRNLQEVRAGPLTLTEGTAASLTATAPVDVVAAHHVLYFWHQPADELARIHAALGARGLLALGYQLRQNMPPKARAAARKAVPSVGSTPGTLEMMAALRTRRVPYLRRYRAISPPPVECTAMSGPGQVIAGQGGH